MKNIYTNFPHEFSSLHKEGIFKPVDINLAEYLIGKSADKSKQIYLSIMLTSNALCKGSLCYDFSISNESDGIETAIKQNIPDITELEKLFFRSRIIGKPGEYLPLIYENQKLYFQKYYQYEKILAEKLKSIAAAIPEINLELLRKNADKLFTNGESEPDFQKIAAVNSCINSLSFISGGPGTGKTTTVVKILLLLIEQLLNKNIEPRIALTAPTGKAAAHLHNSVITALENIKQWYPPVDEYRNFIPGKSFTLHRLLGSIKNSAFFKYNSRNKMPYNIIIIDETSMTDIALMYKFITALSDKMHVIFLGDKDQLASVQAGSVLGDICAFPAENISEKILTNYNSIMETEFKTPVSADCGSIHKNIIFLTKSHRFSDTSGIGKYASLIRDRQTDEIQQLILSNAEKNVMFTSVPIRKNHQDYIKENQEMLHKTVFTENLLNGYVKYFESKTVDEAFMLFKKFKILCAVKKGLFGTEIINEYIEKILHENRKINTKKQFYHLKPVIIQTNDYSLNLFNGDIGITFRDEATGLLKVYFEDNRNNVLQYRTYNPLQLKNYETVFAMTIHKSQGSEYEDILMVIPPDDIPVLTSELIYTGITRAKNRIVIFANEDIFLKACSRKVKRMSGLNRKIYF
ncbi:MAG: exodeoxyribonuclease V subunit alpha [Spirochaetes bacterium]|nr:exodeoxyribonuclease V subunit alpha [Spirochaetota bacterium]